MQAGAIRQLVSAVGLVAWGVLLISAGRVGKLSILNFRWEGKQPQVKAFAARATVLLGIGSVVVGTFMAVTAVL